MLPESGYFEQLFAAACTYLARGWSVIPVYGDADPDRAKVASLSWGAYQHRRCSAAEAHRWFVERRYSGLAVVTGRVSSLAVLDFDDQVRFDAFQRDHPDLVETQMVQTRRGVHLYYHIRAGVSVESRKAAGVDLQFEGRYVVAPPTVVEGHRYQVVCEAAPRSLTEGDVQRLYAFLGAIRQENAPAPVFVPSTSVPDGDYVERLTAGDLVRLYRHLAARLGRNEALFRVSLRARDMGWRRDDVLACLAGLHVRQPSIGHHRNEGPAQRDQEAVRTVESAFSRPPRPRRAYNNAQLPNSVREALFQMGQTFTVRVLEGLRLAGVQPGQAFTTTEALEKLRGQVGRDSVYAALSATTVNGQCLFDHPLPATHPPATADRQRSTTPNKQCFVEKEQKSGRRVFHRPTRRLVMPGNLELCQKLGVKPSVSDPLTSEDLRSAKQTRQAAHRELIKRRPGLYPRRWLARRLGVTIRTLHAYNHAIPIQVRPMYLTLPITWSTVNRIPADFALEGTFLQDETGRQYPPKQAIALRLLAKGHTVVYRRRTANFYFFGEEASPHRRPRVNPGLGLLRKPAPAPIQVTPREASMLAQWTVDVSRPAQAVLVPSSAPVQSIIPSASAPTLAPPQPPTHRREENRSKRFYRRPLADTSAEDLAGQVHFETGAQANRRMSLSNARRLVDTYGAQPVETALKRMVWLRGKGKINNPAGFLVVASRVIWRAQYGATELGMPAPRFRGEPAHQ